MTDRELILDVLSRAGLSRFAPQVERLMKPAVFAIARADEALPLGASRFGGDPDLPPGTPWPHAWEAPMELVAQVRLEDVAMHDVDRVLPRTGSLVFFYNSHWTTSHDERDGQPFDCGRVLHLADGAPLVRTPPPRAELDDEYGLRTVPVVHRPAALDFTPTVTVPSFGAFLAGDDLAELRDAWEDFLYRHAPALPPAEPRPRHQLLGHPVQRDEIEMMSTDDVLLLQLDSDPIPGFDWGKRYFLYFVAPAADVRAGDFSRVRVNHGICG